MKREMHLHKYLYFCTVTVELNSPEDRSSHGDSSGRSGAGPSGHARMEKSFTVKELIERFNEVIDRVPDRGDSPLQETVIPVEHSSLMN